MCRGVVGWGRLGWCVQATPILKGADMPEDCCFAIFTSKRTLDLSARNKADRDLWVEAFTQVAIALPKAIEAYRDVAAKGACVLCPSGCWWRGRGELCVVMAAEICG